MLERVSAQHSARATTCTQGTVQRLRCAACASCPGRVEPGRVACRSPAPLGVHGHSAEAVTTLGVQQRVHSCCRAGWALCSQSPRLAICPGEGAHWCLLPERLLRSRASDSLVVTCVARFNRNGSAFQRGPMGACMPFTWHITVCQQSHAGAQRDVPECMCAGQRRLLLVGVRCLLVKANANAFQLVCLFEYLIQGQSRDDLVFPGIDFSRNAL